MERVLSGLTNGGIFLSPEDGFRFWNHGFLLRLNFNQLARARERQAMVENLVREMDVLSDRAILVAGGFIRANF